MAATDVNPIRETTATARPVERVRRWADETKSAFKTTELYIYVAALVGVLIAGAATKAGSGHDDRFVSTVNQLERDHDHWPR